MTETLTKRKARGGGRAGARTRRGSAVIEQMPWNPPVNLDRPTEPLTEEGVLAIHDGAMRILEEIGIAFLNPEAVEILARAGCTVDGENVRMGRDMVMEWVGKAPSEFTLTPRNPDRRITVGAGTCCSATCPRRPITGTLALAARFPVRVRCAAICCG